MVDIGVYGNCPVQGETIVDGWLFYFRARSGWELCGWAPGRWTPTDPGPFDTEAGASVGALPSEVFLHPDILIHRGGDGFPDPPDGESDYPGWWSPEYAEQVAAWALAEAKRRIEGVHG